ncbi:hypothetical protein IQ238_15825 [Pleurocapsales cyanobacterium LEGE 06147]|nr:hypothetical protein [Pleurocapsales cyanobacterium LEGE 06147]
MSSSHITLKEFVRRVPTCQQEVTLETVLALVRSSQHTTMIVVDRKQQPIGVLDYRRLLPLIAEHLLNRFTPSVGSDRVGGAAAPAKRDRSGIFTQSLDLTSLKEPIVSLSSQMGIQEFLSCFEGQVKTKESSQHYILVDDKGKLLGLLDVHCLIETLLWNWQNTDTTISKNQAYSHWFFELLEQTPLPVTLQATEGQILYQNRCWREQVSNIKESNQPEKTAVSLPQQQPSLLTEDNWQPKPELYPYCLKGNYGWASTLPSLWQPPITAQSLGSLSSLTSELSGDRFRIDEENQNSSPKSFTSLAVPVKVSSKIWQYIKLPIDWTNYQCFPTNYSQKCWLVLAIPNCQTRQFSEGLTLSFKGERGALRASSRAQGEEAVAEYDTDPAGTVHDPSACTPRQEAAAKDAELSELNRLKDEYLASISHELKSPLTAIVGLSSLLKEQKLGTLNQRQFRYAELIYRSGRQLMNIVNDLLDWSRLVTGKLKLNLEPVKIKTICEEVYQQVIARQAAADRARDVFCSKHKFKLNIEPGLETILADKLRLCQILIHLLDNALKLIPPEGEVGISVTLWTKWIAIIVWDTGRSSSEVSQPLVLEQFFRSETSPVEWDKGLGLVLAQQLARAHGGDISFISRVDRGSEFTLLLPFCAENSSQNLQSEARVVLNNNKRICDRQSNSLVLVVEAVSHRINDLASQLEELGYHPIIARTGIEALYKARQLKPSKILLNSSFSLLSGDDILTLLKSDPRTANIPVWLTAEDKQNQEQKTGQINGLLSLPIDKQVLARVLSPIKEQSLSEKKSLMILRLYPGADAVRQHPQSGIPNNPTMTDNSNGDFGLNDRLYRLHHRVIEADSLEQGEILARIWQLDVILLDGSLLSQPLQYLYSLRKCKSLAALPLVTLDAKTTEAANQVDGLSVFPCLVPADQRNLADLVQVIQIAAGIMNQVTSEQ